MKQRVLFVCMGNICRSPAGEAVLQQLVADRDLTAQIEIDSAGTHAYHVGEQADRRMRVAGEKRGYQFHSRARKITTEDLAAFDLVLAMDRDNLKRILALGSGDDRAEVKLLSEFLDGDWKDEVPDPYYGGGKGFEVVLDMIEAACPNIIEYLASPDQ